MAYVDTAENRNRSGPIAAVIAIHAGIGFLLVSGLSTSFIKTIEADFGAVEFPLDPPPPVEDPPKQPEATPESKIVVPDPIIEIPRDVPVEVEPSTFPEMDTVILVPKSLPVPEVTPSVGFDPTPARPRNNPARWVTTDDYPGSPLRKGQEGFAKFRLEISASGKVESCTITRSSGIAQLDKATCRYVSNRAKFHPARDSSDKPIAGQYESSVSWVIPK